MTKRKPISTERLTKILEETEFKDADCFRYILMFTLRNTLTAMKDGSISKGSGLRILNRTVEIGTKFCEVLQLSDKVDTLNAEIEEINKAQ